MKKINNILNVQATAKSDHFKQKQFEAVNLQEWKEYGNEMGVHGFKRLLTIKTSRLGRALWTFLFLFAVGLLIYFSKYLTNRYTHINFKTTIYSINYPIYKVDFPEVTICNKNRLNWSRLEQVKQRFLWPAHHNTSYEQLFIEIVTMYDTLLFGYFDRFAKLRTKPIADLNYINFTEVARVMSWRCDELLTDCIWRNQPMNCCDIFIRRRSNLGICMAFNSVESAAGIFKLQMDSKWPWRVSVGGPQNGLQVRALLNENMHSPSKYVKKGIVLMTVQPKVWSYTPIEIPANLHARVYLDALLSFYDSNTRRVSTKARKCIFKEEQTNSDSKTLYNHDYMYENCLAECQQEYLMYFCNCTMDIFFPIGPYPICKLVDLPCLARHNHELLVANMLHYFEQEDTKGLNSSNKPGLECNCFLNCHSLRYNVKVRTRALRPSEEKGTSNGTVLLDINFMQNSIIVYKTDLVNTWVDLVFKLGNITALFLGCSLISFVEVIYFCCVKVPQRLLRKPTRQAELRAVIPRGRCAQRVERLRSEKRSVFGQNGLKIMM